MSIVDEITLYSGLVVTFFDDGSAALDSESVYIELSASDVSALRDMLNVLHRQGLPISEVPDTVRPVQEPPPFPIVEGIMVKGVDGRSEILVDMAANYQRLELRNALLRQQLAILEGTRDALQRAQETNGNGQAASV